MDGKEKIYSIGAYPAEPLAAARVELGEVKALIRETQRPGNPAPHQSGENQRIQRQYL